MRCLLRNAPRVVLRNLERTDIEVLWRFVDPAWDVSDGKCEWGSFESLAEDGKGRLHVLKIGGGRSSDCSYAGRDIEDIAEQHCFRCYIHGNSILLQPENFNPESCQNSYLEFVCARKPDPASGAAVIAVITEYFDYASAVSDVYLGVVD